MIIYIVIIGGTNIIESVWATEKLAQAAIYYYAAMANLPPEHYNIIVRELNTTHGPKK